MLFIVKGRIGVEDWGDFFMGFGLVFTRGMVFELGLLELIAWLKLCFGHLVFVFVGGVWVTGLRGGVTVFSFWGVLVFLWGRRGGSYWFNLFSFIISSWLLLFFSLWVCNGCDRFYWVHLIIFYEFFWWFVVMVIRYFFYWVLYF